MRIVAIASTKGGVGKSTIAINLATTLPDVVLVDADAQQSTFLFSENREDNNLPRIDTILAESPDELDEAIQSYGNHKKYMIIDCGGRDTVMFRTALIKADLIIVPVTSGQFDFWGTTDTLDLIQEANAFRMQNGLEPSTVACLLNQARTFTKTHKEIEEGLDEIVKDYKVKRLKTILGQREDYRRAILEGQGVVEYKKSSKAATEIVNVIKEIKKLK